jgi:hypothetical protein
MQHLWTHGPQPPELLELRLCRDVYHCTPVQLAEVPLPTILAHLTCLHAEHEKDADPLRRRR